jgi:hypothetical protein
LVTPYNPQNLNAYSYSINNPTTLSDPTGLCPEDLCDGYSQSPWRKKKVVAGPPVPVIDCSSIIIVNPACKKPDYPQDPSTYTAEDLLERFLNGEGGYFEFSDGDFFAEQVRKDPSLLFIIERIRLKILAGKVADTEFKSISDLDTFVLSAERDPADVLSYLTGVGTPENLEVTMLGSYSVDWTADVGQKVARIEITITNLTTVQSATRIPVIGYSDKTAARAAQAAFTTAAGSMIFGTTNLPAQTQVIHLTTLVSMK